MAADLNVALAVRQGFSRGDQQLRFDDVNTGHQLGDRVLHLHPRIHFNEIELIVLIEKLQSARVAVADFPAGFGATLPHGLALFGG